MSQLHWLMSKVPIPQSHIFKNLMFLSSRNIPLFSHFARAKIHKMISQKQMQQKITHMKNNSSFPVSPPTAEIRDYAISYVRRKKIVTSPDYSQRIQIIYVSSPRFLSTNSCDVDVISTFRIVDKIEKKLQVISFNKTLKISWKLVDDDDDYFDFKLRVLQEIPIV